MHSAKASTACEQPKVKSYLYSCLVVSSLSSSSLLCTAPPQLLSAPPARHRCVLGIYSLPPRPCRLVFSAAARVAGLYRHVTCPAACCSHMSAPCLPLVAVPAVCGLLCILSLLRCERGAPFPPRLLRSSKSRGPVQTCPAACCGHPCLLLSPVGSFLPR